MLFKLRPISLFTQVREDRTGTCRGENISDDLGAVENALSNDHKPVDGAPSNDLGTVEIIPSYDLDTSVAGRVKSLQIFLQNYFLEKTQLEQYKLLKYIYWLFINEPSFTFIKF